MLIVGPESVRLIKVSLYLNLVYGPAVRESFIIAQWLLTASNRCTEGHTIWHKILAGVYFCRLAIFCVLQEVIFAIRTDWFFLLGINFYDFQKVPRTLH